MKKFLHTVLLLLFIAALTGVSLMGYRHFQFHRALDAYEAAMRSAQSEQARQSLVLLKKFGPDKKETLQAEARWSATLYPWHALSIWSTYLLSFPEDQEARVARTLVLLRLRLVKQARQEVDAWPSASRDQSAFLRSSLAVNFAENRLDHAREFAQRLSTLEPLNDLHTLNLAKINLLDGTAIREVQIDGQKKLESFLSHPTHRAHALQALLQWHLATKQYSSIEALANQMDRLGDLTLDESLIMLDARVQAGGQPSLDRVRFLWKQSAAHPSDRALLAGWMVRHQYASHLVDWARAELKPEDWVYPLGLPLAEAHLEVSDPLPALSFLRKSNWHQMDYLRLFILARLMTGSSQEEPFLRESIQVAARQPGGWEHLEYVASSWRWRFGQMYILRYGAGTLPLDSVSMSRVMTGLQQLGDAEGLWIGSVRYSDAHPDDPIALNNRAYLSMILDKDSRVSLDMARRAHQKLPTSRSIQTTRLMAEALHGDLLIAQSLLAELQSSQDPVLMLARVIVAHRLTDPLDPQLLRDLQSAHFDLDQENTLKSKWLNKVD
ncbi:MAG: hypothetical protein ACFCUX_00115 [Candidatus Methylacidiphilales bacterium]